MERSPLVPKGQKIYLSRVKTKSSSNREKNRILVTRCFFLMCFLVLLIGGKILLQYYAKKKEEQWPLTSQKEVSEKHPEETPLIESLFEKVTEKFFLQEYNQAQVISF